MKTLNRYRDKLPDRPYCSQGKQLVLDFILPKEEALGFPYIQCNSPYRVNYLAFDLDYEGSAFGYEAHDLPPFTLCAVNPLNAHSHGFYEIPPLPPRQCSKKALGLFRDVTKGYRELLCADKAITTQKQLTKNCLHPKWRVITHDRIYTLTELVEYIPRDLKLRNLHVPPVNKDLLIRPFEEVMTPYSRNCSLFEAGRFYAYAVVKDCRDYKALYDSVYLYIECLNLFEITRYFPVKVNDGELRSITKSVSKWTWNHRGLFTYNRGAMGLPKKPYLPHDQWQEEIKRRESLGGKYRVNQRRETTRHRIDEAIEECKVQGIRPTYRLIAKIIGMSYEHLAKYYKDVFKGVIEY